MSVDVYHGRWCVLCGGPLETEVGRDTGVCQPCVEFDPNDVDLPGAGLSDHECLVCTEWLETDAEQELGLCEDCADEHRFELPDLPLGGSVAESDSGDSDG